ncbi:hypothetical protein BDN71DRAFT_1431251 [Pleurotus eryngii]|uniref:Uncharacterized protein n=1 Tax=Pleurotus eryngii TaxID=5323 RepID=A0A9P5ZZJ4_PLEER|nr:hypothetical protein BDN71DRAFT_1431251 [Pleurotus eryngii]
MPLTGHADATPTRKQARVESSAAPLSLNPPNVSAAIWQGGGTKHISCAEWCRICVQVLEDIVEGARKMLGWSDEAEAMHETLNVVKVMKTALSELDGSVSVDNDIFMSQPAMPASPHDSSLDAFKLEVKDLFCNLEANISTRISNVERRLSSGSASSQSAPSAHNGSNTQQQPPIPTTYAVAAKAGPPGQPKPAQQPKATSTLPAAKPNTKFIVRFQGHLPPEVNCKSSQFLFHHLNQVFNNNAAACNDGLEILGAEWNRNSNINLKITQEPHFVSNPADGLPLVAPVVFAFEDSDGSKLKELPKTPIFMDSRHTPVRPWWEKLKLTQCDRCQGLGHTAKLCNKPNICTKCAQRHPTTEHNIYCLSVLKDGSSTCKCMPQCANCEGDCWATEPSCPEKRKYVLRPVPPPPPQASQARQLQLQMPAQPAPPPPMQEPWFGHIGLDKADSMPEGCPINSLPVSPAWESFALFSPGRPKVATYLTPEEFAQESELAGSETPSDLTFFNCSAINAATFTPLIVDEDLSFGLDHNALVYAANLPVLEDKGASDNLDCKPNSPKGARWWNDECQSAIEEM